MPELDVRLMVRLPRVLREELERLAERNERSPSAEVRRAIRAHIEAAGIRESLERGHE